MNSISINTTKEQYVITIDKKKIKFDYVLNLVEKLRMEHLAQSLDFDEDIEQMGKEIKSNWWSENKERMLGNYK